MDSFVEDLENIFAGLEDPDDAKAEEERRERMRRLRERRIQRKIDRTVARLLKKLADRDTVEQEDREILLRTTATKIVESTGALAMAIYLARGEELSLEQVYYSQRLWLDDPSKRESVRKHAEELRGLTIPRDGSRVVQLVARSGTLVVTLDSANDPTRYGHLDELFEFDVKSVMTIPLAVEGQPPIGVVQVMNKDPRTGEEFFSRRDIQRLQKVAAYSASVIWKSWDPNYEAQETDLAKYVASLTKRVFMDLSDYEPESALLEVVGQQTLERMNVLPLEKVGTQGVRVVVSNPLDQQLLDTFESATGMEVVEVLVAAPRHIRLAIKEAFQVDQLSALTQLAGKEFGIETVDVDEKDQYETSTPVTQLVNRIIEDAFARGASDIHIEPYEDETIVRYRVDGMLADAVSLTPGVTRPVTARLKIMSDLDISERRLPQDGRIPFKKFTDKGIDIDLRVSIIPNLWGEKTCMRLLNKTATTLGLELLGYEPDNLEVYRNLISQPFGMILHVGPTGSGKTTTLYSALAEVAKPTVNVQTAEDPVEYPIKRINQLQMHTKIGLNFGRALRSFMRQDPDIILVGEIRDEETASVAIEAALTGHLLFSTLHTNDAAGTVTRLVDMGVPPFLVVSALLCICAQRLMRRVCKDCKIQIAASEEDAKVIGVEVGASIYTAAEVNCQRCRGSGYKGRVGTHEILTLNDEIRRLTLQGAGHSMLKKAAVAGGMTTLHRDSMTKVENGLTTIAEALRVVRPDDI